MENEPTTTNSPDIEEQPAPGWMGYLDHISGSRIAGWARSKTSDQPVEVVLYINDRETMRTRADRFRQDLLDARVHPEGTCAFEFRIEESVQLSPHDTVRVRPAGSGEDLPAVRELPKVIYADWTERYYRLKDSDRNAIREHIRSFSHTPLLSVVMPVYNTPVPVLKAALDSVINQLYPHWELCVADDASTDPEVRNVLNEYQQKDSRIRVVYRKANGHICEASNSALELAGGEFAAFLDHDDELTEDALYHVAHELNTHPDADIIYSDEDKINLEGERWSPHFKPDWNPDYLTGVNYMCHLTVIRTSLVRKAGSFRKGFEGAQDYDLLLRCVPKTTGDRIRHIPRVLYHWRMMKGTTAHSLESKSYAIENGRKALEDYFQRLGQPVRVTPIPDNTMYRIHRPVPHEPPQVTIIIPTRNQKSVLEACIRSIRDKTRYSSYEIVIVNNQSDERDCLEYLDTLKRDGTARVIDYDHPFNFSALNNFAAASTEGELLCFLNNDTEVVNPKWLEEMVAHAVRPEIGAVGAKLLYRNDTVQHAGIITGIGGFAGHPSRRSPGNHSGVSGRLWLMQNFSAVTAACLLVRREVFEQVGGFDEQLTVALNDVDLCLQIQQAGYRNLWTPHAVLYHHESRSRGPENDPQKLARLEAETRILQERWDESLLNDPHYNPNYSLDSEQWELACPPRTRPPWAAYLPSTSGTAPSNPSGEAEFLINRGYDFLNRGRLLSLKNQDKTLIVVGVARSGTSLLSGVLHHLGVFMGDRAIEPVYEDVRLAEAYEGQRPEEVRAVIQEYNRRHPVWGFKRPSFLHFLPSLLESVRNPVCLFVFRDIFAISKRNRISTGQNPVSGLETAARQYLEMVNFIQTCDPCGLLFSYEKAFEFQEEWVDLLVKTLGISATTGQKEDALNFVSRNSEDYLKNTRAVKIVGYVEEIDAARVAGWARNADSAEPVDVNLYVNGRRILRTRADRPRRGGADGLAASDSRSGFEFNLDAGTPLKPGDAVQVRVLGDMDFLPQVAGAKRMPNS